MIINNKEFGNIKIHLEENFSESFKLNWYKKNNWIDLNIYNPRELKEELSNILDTIFDNYMYCKKWLTENIEKDDRIKYYIKYCYENYEREILENIDVKNIDEVYDEDILLSLPLWEISINKFSNIEYTLGIDKNSQKIYILYTDEEVTLDFDN